MYARAQASVNIIIIRLSQGWVESPGTGYVCPDSILLWVEWTRRDFPSDESLVSTRRVRSTTPNTIQNLAPANILPTKFLSQRKPPFKPKDPPNIRPSPLDHSP